MYVAIMILKKKFVELALGVRIAEPVAPVV